MDFRGDSSPISGCHTHRGHQWSWRASGCWWCALRSGLSGHRSARYLWRWSTSGVSAFSEDPAHCNPVLACHRQSRSRVWLGPSARFQSGWIMTGWKNTVIGFWPEIPCSKRNPCDSRFWRAGFWTDRAPMQVLMELGRWARQCRNMPSS